MGDFDEDWEFLFVRIKIFRM
uniref:Uncharacterized protein n=1 Tax=Moniliophthora roreri TaxID=221103 RepID=A0A0W0G239_MONRR